MKLTKTASGKKVVKMSKKEWLELGKKAGWTSEAGPIWDKTKELLSPQKPWSDPKTQPQSDPMVKEKTDRLDLLKKIKTNKADMRLKDLYKQKYPESYKRIEMLRQYMSWKESLDAVDEYQHTGETSRHLPTEDVWQHLGSWRSSANMVAGQYESMFGVHPDGDIKNKSLQLELDAFSYPY